MLRKRRQARGVRQGSAKLSEWKVIAIMARWLMGAETLKDLARDFSISRRQLSRVVNGEDWAYLFAHDTEE